MSILQNTSQKSSQDMPNNSRINNLQDHQHSVRIGALTKQTLKKYLM